MISAEQLADEERMAVARSDRGRGVLREMCSDAELGTSLLCRNRSFVSLP